MLGAYPLQGGLPPQGILTQYGSFVLSSGVAPVGCFIRLGSLLFRVVIQVAPPR